jgi:hypothetical protein
MYLHAHYARLEFFGEELAHTIRDVQRRMSGLPIYRKSVIVRRMFSNNKLEEEKKNIDVMAQIEQV